MLLRGVNDKFQAPDATDSSVFRVRYQPLFCQVPLTAERYQIAAKHGAIGHLHDAPR